VHDADESPWDRYETPFDGDEETHRDEAALDWIEARLERLTRLVT
jgi:hypothetical protein